MNEVRDWNKCDYMIRKCGSVDNIGSYYMMKNVKVLMLLDRIT